MVSGTRKAPRIFCRPRPRPGLADSVFSAGQAHKISPVQSESKDRVTHSRVVTSRLVQGAIHRY